jgi:hypothetical protein
MAYDMALIFQWVIWSWARLRPGSGPGTLSDYQGYGGGLTSECFRKNRILKTGSGSEPDPRSSL